MRLPISPQGRAIAQSKGCACSVLVPVGRVGRVRRVAVFVGMGVGTRPGGRTYGSGALGDLLSTQTFVAQSEQQEVMTFELEPFGREPGKISGALLDLVHLAARAAVKVVVVGFARGFVAGWLSGHRDFDNLAIGDQRFDRAVHRGHTHALDSSLREFQNLASRDRTMGLVNRGTNSRSLPGVAFHGLRKG